MASYQVVRDVTQDVINANEAKFEAAHEDVCYDSASEAFRSAALSVSAAYDSVRVATADVDSAAARVAAFALVECKNNHDDARTVARTAARILDKSDTDRHAFRAAMK